MSAMKKKRRKKIKNEWAEFQEFHGLSDECRKQARAIGDPLQVLQEKLADASVSGAMSMADRIGMMYRQRQDERAQHAALIESGEIEPKLKKSKKNQAHDPRWAKAKTVCRLNMEDIRMAKELGMTSKSLMKNVPSPTQRWKAPVNVWIRDLYEQHQQRCLSKTSSVPATPTEPQPHSHLRSESERTH